MLVAHEAGRQPVGSLPGVGAWQLLSLWGFISFLFAFSLPFAFSTAVRVLGGCFPGWSSQLSHHQEQSPALMFSNLG